MAISLLLRSGRMQRAPLLLFLAWLSVSFYSGIWLFMSGFLLMRIELNNQSFCSEPPSPAPHLQAGSCWFPQRFDKAVIVVIDALKYDFAKYDPANNNPKPYENKLGVIHQLTTSQPQHARLYPFRADPPTTTMQRIKGFTTGSLPTFVDVGSNFASYAIQEDNLIHQMVQNGTYRHGTIFSFRIMNKLVLKAVNRSPLSPTHWVFVGYSIYSSRSWS